jgi:hypothetical protein
MLLNPTVEDSGMILDGWKMCLPNSEVKYFITCDAEHHQVYTIKSGDWISKIVQAEILEGTENDEDWSLITPLIEEIMCLNPLLKNADKISIGLELCLPPKQ